MLTSAKNKRDLFCEQKSMVTWWQQSTKSSTKDVNLGTITDAPCQTKTSQETEKNLRKFLEPSQKPKVINTDNFCRIWQSLGRIIMELSNSYTSSIRDKRNCRTSCTWNKRRDISRTIAIWIEWKMVVKLHEMLLLSARWPRPPGKWEISKNIEKSYFPVTDGSAKLSGRDYEFQETTLRRWSTARRENLSGESHGDREDFQSEESEDDAEARKNLGYSRKFHLLSSYCTEKLIFCAERRIILHFTSFTLLIETPPRRNVRCGRRIGEKPKHFEAKTNSIVFEIAGKGRNYVPCSDQRTWWIESYVWFRRLWRSVSQRRMPRETEKHKQKIFHPKQCWIFKMQRRQWKRDERRS